MRTDQSKKLFDVAHPGKSVPSATSRPIIVGHGPMMQDPMMQDTNTKTEVKTIPKAIIEPIKPSAETEEVSESESSSKSPIKIGEDKSTDDEKLADDSSDSKPESPVTSSETAVVDAVVDQATDKKKQAETDKKAVEQQSRVEELITKKTYFVPINVAKRRDTTRLAVWLLLLFAAAAAGTAYALQTGLISL